MHTDRVIVSPTPSCGQTFVYGGYGWIIIGATFKLGFSSYDVIGGLSSLTMVGILYAMPFIGVQEESKVMAFAYNNRSCIYSFPTVTERSSRFEEQSKPFRETALQLIML